jgi:hypothetical protein
MTATRKSANRNAPYNKDSRFKPIQEDFSNSGYEGFSPLTTTNKGGNDTMLTPHSTSSMGN